MIALATVILTIIGTGSFMRACGKSAPGESGEVVLCDTIRDGGVRPYASGERVTRGKKKSGADKKGKDRRKKKSVEKKEGNVPAARRHLEEDLSGEE